MNEGGWSALEIIVVLILAVALLDRLFGTPNLPSTTNQAKTTTTDKKTQSACNKIVIHNPKPLEKIVVSSQGVSVAASIASCATSPMDPDIFVLSVVDAQGNVIASPQEVFLSGVSGGWSFNHFAIFDTRPKAGTGYIIVTRLTSNGVQVADGGARLPIRFVNQ